MTALPELFFLNPVLTALQTTHAHLAITAGEAFRYPAGVAPFAAIASPSTAALCDLRNLLLKDEYVWITAVDKANPALASLALQTTIEVHQMALPPHVELPLCDPAILPLDCSRAVEMVALTDVAFPGFFRPRTCEMGNYFGTYSNKELIAMGGERLVFPGYSEISGLCTHPAHRGQGHAARMLWHLARFDRQRGIVPWLHVTATNHSAVNLYLKLGFEIVRTIGLHQIARA